MAYWVSEAVFEAFTKGIVMGKLAEPRQGMSTCDVDYFTREWYEVEISKTNVEKNEKNKKWIKYNKGGAYRKWYGNRENLVLWNNDGDLLLKKGALLRNKDVYFKKFIAWTKISSAGTGFRWFEDNFLFDGAGGSLFIVSEDLNEYYCVALLNSSPIRMILDIISPTLNYNENHIGSIPVLFEKVQENSKFIEEKSKENIRISKEDWDSFETSWDFKKHPMI